MDLQSIKEKLTVFSRKLLMLTFLVIVTVSLLVSLKTCQDNITQDRKDAELLEKIDKRTDMIIKDQEVIRELGRRLDNIERKMSEAAMRLSR